MDEMDAVVIGLGLYELQINLLSMYIGCLVKLFFWVYPSWKGSRSQKKLFPKFAYVMRF